MTLSTAITARLIVPASLDGWAVWTCARCRAYLIYFHGGYHWGCGCHEGAK